MKPFYLFFSLLLTFIVVTAGAYVRLSDAGLGCPDWPGCYGKIIGVAEEDIASKYYPDSPYDLKKAWIEVGHRYIAGLLGLLVAFIAIRDFLQQRRWGIAQTTLLLIIGQALLGMLTVTEKLNPTVVTSHLLGGMTILALVSIMAFKSILPTIQQSHKTSTGLRIVFLLCAMALLLQIFLGGWVSTNYAALACPAFPLCQTTFTPPHIDFSGYKLGVPLHLTDANTHINAAMLATIHWAHRLGAILLTVLLLLLVFLLVKSKNYTRSLILLATLLLQIILGLLNVVWQLPLWTAVMHNAVAALLVIVFSHLWVNFYIYRLK